MTAKQAWQHLPAAMRRDQPRSITGRSSEQRLPQHARVRLIWAALYGPSASGNTAGLQQACAQQQAMLYLILPESAM